MIGVVIFMLAGLWQAYSCGKEWERDRKVWIAIHAYVAVTFAAMAAVAWGAA